MTTAEIMAAAHVLLAKQASLPETQEAEAEFMEELEAWLATADNKAEALAWVIREAKKRRQGWAIERDAIARRMKRAESTIERCEGILSELLTMLEHHTGEPRADFRDGSWCRIQRRKTQVVHVADVVSLPDEYVKRTELKREIGDALKAGREVPGAELRDNVSEFLRFSS